MRKITYSPYLLLGFSLLSLISLPEKATESIRSAVVCSLAPCWTLGSFPLPFWNQVSPDRTNTLEMERLQQENQILRAQIENVREWLLNEDRLQDQVERLKLFTTLAQRESEWKSFFERRSKELCAILEFQALSCPAQVIFREPSSWSSSIWINVGQEDNIRFGKEVIAKNSSVLAGNSVIGVVDYVGGAQSRVRLITDACLRLSVRAVRGGEQNRYLMEHLGVVLFALETRQDLFPNREEADGVVGQLRRLGTMLAQHSGESYLAKGELFGSSSPLWRSRSPVLKGIGFNYDFSDREGLGRDLRTGAIYGSFQTHTLPILKAGDLLVTTGFDGVFPAGLRVASVSSVKQLKEGASSYELEAIATVGDFNELVHVTVLPPLKTDS